MLNAVATLIAFELSRTDRGIMGFTETPWTPSPEAATSVAVGIAAALRCVASLLLPPEPAGKNNLTTPLR